MPVPPFAESVPVIVRLVKLAAPAAEILQLLSVRESPVVEASPIVMVLA